MRQIKFLSSAPFAADDDGEWKFYSNTRTPQPSSEKRPFVIFKNFTFQNHQPKWYTAPNTSNEQSTFYTIRTTERTFSFPCIQQQKLLRTFTFVYPLTNSEIKSLSSISLRTSTPFSVICKFVFYINELYLQRNKLAASRVLDNKTGFLKPLNGEL